MPLDPTDPHSLSPDLGSSKDPMASTLAATLVALHQVGVHVSAAASVDFGAIDEHSCDIFAQHLTSQMESRDQDQSTLATSIQQFRLSGVVMAVSDLVRSLAGISSRAKEK